MSNLQAQRVALSKVRHDVSVGWLTVDALSIHPTLPNLLLALCSNNQQAEANQI